MSKQISQDFFDATVKENIEEFDMTPEEALRDTIQQFENQGVDLRYIDKSGGRNREEISSLLQELLTYSDSISSVSDSTLSTVTVMNLFSNILPLIDEKHEFHERNINLLHTGRGIRTLFNIFFHSNDILLKSNERKNEKETIVSLLLKILVYVTKKNVERRDMFEPGGSNTVCDVIGSVLNQGNYDSSEILLWTLKLVKYASKSEHNKAMLMKYGYGDMIVTMLTNDYTRSLVESLQYDSNQENQPSVSNLLANDDDPSSQISSMYKITWASILQETFLSMRELCTHNDYRSKMSCAFDNGRFFLKVSGIPETLTKLSLSFKVTPKLATAALQASRSLLTNEESVKLFADLGMIGLPSAILRDESCEQSLVRAIAGLTRNLCADDERKHRLVSDGTLRLMLHALSKERNLKDEAFADHSIASLAMMALRSPKNGQIIVSEYNGLAVLVRCMYEHVNNVSIQRQSCLTIRNIAARNPELRQAILDSGVENALRLAGRLVADESYAALRDLNLPCQIVSVNEDGTVSKAYQQFGERQGSASSLQFNPVFEESFGIQESMVTESRPPMPHVHSDGHDCC